MANERFRKVITDTSSPAESIRPNGLSHLLTVGCSWNARDAALLVTWILTIWHFVDGELYIDKFRIAWEVGENALVRIYTKEMNEKGRIRPERQEYAREEKLYAEENACRHEGNKGEVE